MSIYTPGDLITSLVSGQHFLTVKDRSTNWGEKVIDSANIGGGAFSLSTPRVYTGQQNFGAVALTDGATVNWNLNTQQFATLTLAGNRTLANPTNLVAGGTYLLIVTQDGTGSRTLSYGTSYRWEGGVAPVLSTAANAVDILTFVSNGTHMFGVAQKGFA